MQIYINTGQGDQADRAYASYAEGWEFNSQFSQTNEFDTCRFLAWLSAFSG